MKRPALRLVEKPAPAPAVWAPPACRHVPLTEDLFRIVYSCQPNPVPVTEAVLGNVLARDYAYAILDGGVVACALGVFLIHPGRAHGWILKTPLARPRHMAYAVKNARERFDFWQASDPNFRRIEMQVADGEPWRESFAKRLGMTCEGLMRKWDVIGRDHWLYARIAP